MPPHDSPQSPPVVLQVLPSLVTGGVERGAIEIAQAIAEAEAVSLVASAGGPLVPAIQRVGGRHIQLPLQTKDPIGIWRNAAKLEAIIRAEKVSIVHARSRAPAWSAWLACRRTGAHFVTTYHGVYNENLPFKRRYNAIMAKGEIVIAASQYVAEVILRQHKTPADRIRVIPRGIDPAIYDPEAVPADRIVRMAQAMRVPDGMHTIVMLGRLTAWKGQAIVLQAIARLNRQDVCCVFVGSNQGRAKYSKHLETLAATLGIADRVRMIGHVDDVPAALMLSDVVVHASTDPEAFGRVVIEAQAMGRPTVATNLGGPAETVKHGVTGWLTPPGDPETMARHLEDALSLDAASRHALGQRSRAAVLENYTVRAMQDSTLDVYTEILTRAQARQTHAGVTAIPETQPSPG